MDRYDLKVGDIDVLNPPHQEAVCNTKRFMLDTTLDKAKMYQLLAVFAIQEALKQSIMVPAEISKLSKTATPVKATSEKASLLGNKPPVAGCCIIV